MTISTTNPSAGPFLGNGVTASFPFAFKCFRAEDLRVVRTLPEGDPTDLVLSSQFSVTLNPNQNTAPGGSVVLVAPLANGATLRVLSAVAPTQGVALINGGAWSPTVIEDALDRLALVDQQGILAQAALAADVGVLGARVDELAGEVAASAEEVAELGAQVAATQTSVSALVVSVNSLSTEVAGLADTVANMEQGESGITFTQPNSVFVSDSNGDPVELQAATAGHVLTFTPAGFAMQEPTGGGVTFTQPHAVLVSDANGDLVELQAVNDRDVLTFDAATGLVFEPPETPPSFSLSTTRQYTAPQVETSLSLGSGLDDTVSVDCSSRSNFYGEVSNGALVILDCIGMLDGQTVQIVLSRGSANTAPAIPIYIASPNPATTLYVGGTTEMSSGSRGVIIWVTRRGPSPTRFVEIKQLVAVATPAPPDYTTALSRLPFDGTINDVSGATVPGSPSGPAVFSTSEKVFGTASLHVAADRSIRFNNSSIFNRQTGDFAYQMWAKRDAANSSLSDRMFLFGNASAAGDGTETTISVVKLVSGVLSASFRFTDNSVVTLTGPQCPSDFFHCYVARKSDKVIFAVDGVAVTATVPVDRPLRPIGSAATMELGRLGSRPGPHLGEYGMSWNGWIDHFVYTDFAQWDDSFTPPNNPI